MHPGCHHDPSIPFHFNKIQQAPPAPKQFQYEFIMIQQQSKFKKKIHPSISPSLFTFVFDKKASNNSNRFPHQLPNQTKKKHIPNSPPNSSCKPTHPIETHHRKPQSTHRPNLLTGRPKNFLCFGICQGFRLQ